MDQVNHTNIELSDLPQIQKVSFVIPELNLPKYRDIQEEQDNLRAHRILENEAKFHRRHKK